MKLTTNFRMVVVFWAALLAMGGCTFWRAVETERDVQRTFANPLEYIFSTWGSRPWIEYARQRIRLCELALSTESDAGVIPEAEAKFREIQQRYGQLRITDQNAVAIVTIPEISLPERVVYAWRIHVPAGQHVELAAYLGDGDKTVPGFFKPSDFAQTLPLGESVIRMVCERGQIFEWGSVAPKDLPQGSTRLMVAVNEDDFRWQSNSGRGAISRVKLYPSQQTLFRSEDTVELMQLHATATAQFKRDLHLVLRQTKLTSAE